MKKAVLRFMSCCMAVGFTFTGLGTVALAEGSVTLAGLSESAKVVSYSGDVTAAKADEPEQAAEEEEVAAEPVYDTSMSGELAFAQCENYINVRAEASTDGEVVGKVYNNGSVTILGQLGDWYEVQSGNVSGYVKTDFFATGEEAQEIADAVAYNVATVYPEALMIRSEPSEDSESIGMAYSSDQLEVVAYEGDWMKVALGNDVYGYINAWYVGYDTYYATAETLEEEQQRLDEQWLAYLAEQEAEAAAQAAAEAAAAAAYTEPVYTDTSSSSASIGLSEAEAAANDAYQKYVEAQAAADAATHQADEQLVYETYDEAVSAYGDYLEKIATVDEIKASQTTSDTGSTAQPETTAPSTEAQTEAYVPQTEAPQTEAQQTEAAYVETESSSSSASTSTLGSSIANFAVQFVGNPYVYGGTSLTNGADCSGFTQSVFANFGISIPRTAAEQAGSGTAVSVSDIQPGDLLFYSEGSGISHVAIYIGGGQIVHASTSTKGIVISNYNYRTPVCARRYW